MLIVGGYEGAIHSVHHLGDTNAAAHCRVASSHEHVNVIDVEVPRLGSAMPAARPDPIPVPPSPARIVALAPDVGRAPPA